MTNELVSTRIVSEVFDVTPGEFRAECRLKTQLHIRLGQDQGDGKYRPRAGAGDSPLNLPIPARLASGPLTPCCQ